MSAPAFEDISETVPLRAGARFGRHVLCYELASGGMGTVYLAKTEGPGGFEKLVALKRVHPHLARDHRFATMFLDEARIAARIHHPNVCGVHDFGEEEGTFYLTMPYIAGEPLHRVLRAASRAEGPLAALRPWMMARIVTDVCEGLHAAHELRDEEGRLLEVVHRDVSPQNVMVGYDGSARILDFGVASARHRHYQTSTGEVKGKFAYLAPEQIDAKPADRRVDIWALGVVLWEGIAGRRLFAREAMAAVVRAVTHDPIPPLADAVPGIAPELQAVVDRALARDPAQRYRTTREMGRDLLAALSRHHVLGPADVAEWLEALFPEGRRSVERLVELSRVLSLTEVSGIEEAPTRAAAPTPTPTPTVEPAIAPLQAAPAVVPAGRRAAFVGAAALMALLGVGIGVGVSLGGSRDDVRDDLRDDVLRAPASAFAPPTPRGAASADGADAPPAPEAARVEADLSAPAPAAAPPAQDAFGAPATPEPEPEPAPSASPPSAAATMASATARGAGTVNVAVPGGWAIVYRGRTRLGEAPGSFSLPAGTQQIGVQPFGEGPIQRRSVDVPAGGVVRLSVAAR
ncbi:MAG: serine/threonine protein kinase [Myxococcales bacterium]|nr:serine/threonine protein kinase [Myxococcales bacterium]